MLTPSKAPTGLLLQSAGLISAQQLQTALEIQAQYTEIKLGEILVAQVAQDIKAETIDFFVDRWHKLCEQGRIFPLGYYLRKAYLLNQQQIKTILEEQKNNSQKLGTIAVAKGWIRQETINFFLDNLSSKPPQIMSLNALKEYNRAKLHLEKKYADHALLLSRILAWTGGIPYLTTIIGQVFAQSDFNIPKGKEINAVDRFVEGTLIRKWRTSKITGSIRAISYSLLNNFRCDSKLLLKEYQNILISDKKKYQGNKEQKELLLLGLVVRENEELRVSNIIYQHIFNQEFIANGLAKMLPKASEPNNLNHPNTAKSASSIVEYSPQISLEKAVPLTQTNAQVQLNSQPQQTISTPAQSTRISSLIACTAIALLVPFFLTITNYLSSSKPQEATANSPQKIKELQQFCHEVNFANSQSSLGLISKLETEQQQLLNNFPATCNAALNHLRIVAAPQLGKENRILEAIRHLCKVPANSEMNLDAKVWLKRWYDSPSWGKETKFYLEEIHKHEDKSCPAAHFAEYEG